MAFPRYDLFPPEDQQLSEYFRDFGHPLRKTIILDLKHGKLSVSEMLRRYPLSRDTVYQHLTILRRTGLVHFEEVSPHTEYWRNEAEIERVKTALQDFINSL